MDFLEYIEKKEADSGEKGKIYYLNLNKLLVEFGSNSVLQCDFMRFLACFQGIVNRSSLILFIEYIDQTDRFWYNYLRQPGKILYGYKVYPIDTVDEFFRIFSVEIKNAGLIEWDENVFSTANVAVTVCGVKNYLPVRKSATEGGILGLVIKKTGAVVKMSLVDKFTGTGIIPDTNRKSSGSAKCDAYLWAMEMFLSETSDCLLGNVPDAMPWNYDKETTPDILAMIGKSEESLGGIDSDAAAYPDLQNTAMMNLDYYTSNKVFIFDLSPWGDEKPSDDPEQPMGCDKATFIELLARIYARTGGNKIISVSGFVPWHLKYTTYRNNGCNHEVKSEWEYVELLSAYNAILDADGIQFISLPNISIYQKYKILNQLRNNRPKQIVDYDKSKKYVLMYMGDYDSSVWTGRFLPKWWTDPCHGSRPLAWPFNPNLSDRVPMVFEYAYEYKKDNDFFIGGDSGAGYLNPTLLLEPRKHSDNPSGMQLWIEHNKKYYKKMDLDITGFLLNGALPIDDRVLDAYCEISPKGTGIHNYANCKILHKNGVFFDVATFIAGQDGDPEGVYTRTMEMIQAIDAPQFHALRSVLCSPTYMENLISKMQECDPDIEVVDPYTFFELLRISAGG